ncbi:hypothetical protein [Micromonospora sp. KC213]|uniref:hypothetical protein n=1 Tax=Micromonospora sp. KC213 TaxID=2530378 RepID=UPI0010434807|nr:hypothetical protein [Micromonospora sp. KC213]TDC30505.1 hypothetical protein E1166_28825 [Micromonospora sp. KC213]
MLVGRAAAEQPTLHKGRKTKKPDPRFRFLTIGDKAARASVDNRVLSILVNVGFLTFAGAYYKAKDRLR